MAKKAAANEIPATPQDRRLLLNVMSERHALLDKNEIKTFDKLAEQVAIDDEQVVKDEDAKIAHDRKKEAK